MIEPAIYDNERRFLFTNWSSEDFTGTIGGISETIKSGETKEFPMFKAYLFTKHFVNREMMRNGREVSMDSPEVRQGFEEKTIAEITANIQAQVVNKLKEKIDEKIEEEKGVKKNKEDKVAEAPISKEFEDINKVEETVIEVKKTRKKK